MAGLVVAAQDIPEFDMDPYLEYRPPFAQSLPVQILLTGVVLTLVAVLFIHLIFTAQYHWPLAPVNYVFQISGVTTLLISLIATMQVILSTTHNESEKWPYMLSYIAVNVPPFDKNFENDDWNIAERATWLITHIQFLTLLYPSRLEGRLIFALLGPLAIVAAVMQLIPINESENANSVASAVRNVCNATLSLLFTAALFIWGLLVNRNNAWRTDGGTAAFGAAALSLAVVSTALNFLYVHREEEYVWLPGLMWAVILWQSFLGWWWWVGAGSSSGFTEEVDILEQLEKDTKREIRRKEARERRKENRLRAKKVWRGVTSAFVPQGTGNRGRSHSIHRVNTQRTDRSATSHSPSSSLPDASPDLPDPALSVSSTSTNGSLSTLPRLLPPFVHRCYASLRHAHLIAARQQAVERVERIRERERNGIPDPVTSGWGLGSFAWRTRREEDLRSPSQEFEMHHRYKWPVHAVDLQGQRQDKESDEQDDEDEANDTQHPPPPISPPLPQLAPLAPAAPRQRSMWWWGPLARWRLQDSTSY
ncbi:hypothetical protein H0H87_004158 [Tephrocybe sp. NHM501043]|nr:hypothetical protein H0H87_004158 [Tephrocybe sp. NHM501043]